MQVWGNDDGTVLQRRRRGSHIAPFAASVDALPTVANHHEERVVTASGALRRIRLLPVGAVCWVGWGAMVLHRRTRAPLLSGTFGENVRSLFQATKRSRLWTVQRIAQCGRE